ncbi:MAG: YigZ family protein [Mycoplasmoidaceae bacterium]|nr:YigZ family protein [Mycoplasmoidaceae bacterium]
MKILSKEINSSFTIKKSKFLCFGFIVNSKEEVKNKIDYLKKEYPDASHICYAYIFDDKTYYFTDGGEPSGTAGKPIYGALLSSKLNYTLLVVVRYFGGIKFGPGPLRSTFKDVATQTLKLAEFKTCNVCDLIQIKVEYSQVKKIDSIFKQEIYNKKFEKEFVLITLAGDKNKISSKLKLLNLKPISIKENQVV